MKKEIIIFIGVNLLIFNILSNRSFGQTGVGPTRSSIVTPVDIPIFLAGSFGESRANHFHSGIDIKTNGVTGIPVHAIADGYVSRIKVEPGGYGHALYIRHSNGYTSLYGHLQSYNEAIDQYVQSEQYRRESFEVDLFPEPSLFVVKKGQVVALSGNSGSSGGPHLHFELRKSSSENPVNPLIQAVAVKDDIPPVINKLMIYSLKGRHDRVKPITVPLTRNNSVYSSASAEPVPFDAVSGIGIETYDMMDQSSNHCGVYKMQGYLDNELFFESRLDEISFAQTRYMNSFMDYGMYETNHIYVLKLFIDPNNKANIYKSSKNRGYIELKDMGIHKVKLVVSDAAGNQSIVQLNVKLNPAKFRPGADALPLYDAFFSYKSPNSFHAQGIDIDIPEGALYDDLYFTYGASEPLPGSYSPLHQISNEKVPVHLYYRLAIEPAHLPDRLKGKATIAQYEGNNTYTCLGGTWEGNSLVARTRNFGAFCILVDTIKPVISPMNFSSGSNIKSLNSIKLTIKDDLSGIRSYRGEIDGKWVLFEFDSKNSLLEYRFDRKRFQTGKQHQLVLRVTDQMSNTASYTVSFFK